MKPSIVVRFIAAATSFTVTFVLFSAVASLAEPPPPAAGVQLVQAPLPVTR